MKNIILCGGGTAGHVMPAIALVPKLKKHYQHIFYIGQTNGIEQDIAKHNGLEFYGITCTKLRRNLTLKNALIPFKMIKGVTESVKLLKKIKPAVIFSKGGYAALPVVIGAKLLKIPVIAHESDFSPGLSNKISSKFCKVVCTSFDNCAKKFKNGIYTGSPVREELFYGNKEKFLKDFSFDNNKPMLLFMGGSSGAKFINNILRESLDKLLIDFNIIHITGKGNKIESDKKGYIQIEFTQNIENIFAATDYVISRAGSNTVFELLILKKPLLLIPLPKDASRGDQLENAEYFYNKGCVMTADQKNLNSEKLISKIKLLIKEKNNIINNIEKNNINNGNHKIINQILKFSK